MVNLKNRSFLTLKDYSKEEIRYLLDMAHRLKKAKKNGRVGTALKGKNVVLLCDFFKQFTDGEKRIFRRHSESFRKNV